MKFSTRALRRIPMAGVWALSIVAVGAASATAGGMISGAQVANGSLSGADLKDGSVGFGDLSAGAKQRIVNNAVRKARNAAPGAANSAAPGVNGKDGAAGKDGAPGRDGTNGTNGTDGAPGLNGRNAPLAEYGLGGVWLDRGAGYGVWGVYSSPAIPAVDGIPAQASGEFRFTCNNVNGCKVALTGVVASDASTDDAKVQVHLQLERTSDAGVLNSKPTTFCEASEVAHTAAPASIARVPLGTSPYATIGDKLVQGIGGSVDCGGGAAFAAPNANVDTNATASGIQVTEYVVPQGYYNANATFRFFR